MDPINDTRDAIREINRSYIKLAQLLMHENKMAAMATLGLTPAVADVLSALPSERADRLASSGQLLCFFRPINHSLLSALAVKFDQTAAAVSSGSIQQIDPGVQMA